MPTTPGGTTWATTTTTLPNGRLAALSATTTPSDWIILYTHGSSGNYNQFATLGVWYGLRNWVMDEHIPVVEAGPGNDWGGVLSRETYEQALTWARTQVPATHVIILGRSMGGLIAYWLATQSAFEDDVAALMINSGTTDLAYRYAIANPTHTQEMNTAYGVPGSARNIPAFTAASAGHNPMLFDTEVWDGRQVMQLYGTADATVPPIRHAIPWIEKYSDHAEITVDVRVGGDHTASNGSYLQVAEMATFIQDLRGEEPSPPPPPPPLRDITIRDMFWVGPTGQLHSMHPQPD